MLSHSHLISYHVIIGVVQNRRYMSIQINTIHFWHHKYYCPESTDANPNECRKYCWSSRVLSIISYIDWFRSMRYLVRNDLHLLPRGGFRNVKKKSATTEANPTIKLVKTRSKHVRKPSQLRISWQHETATSPSGGPVLSGLSVLHPENPPESATPIVVDHWAHPIALDEKNQGNTNPWRPTYIPSSWKIVET